MPQHEKIECRMCLHYYVTWDKQLPHGCRAMKFKSKEVPSAVVKKSSGKGCLLFEPKKKRVASTKDIMG
jgi:hypothetical protein